LPAGFKGINSTAEIQIDKAGKFLFVSNRGDDSLAIFSIDKTSGKLTAAGRVPTGGKTPRFFTLDPTEKFLFAGNQESNTVTVFKVNASTARLTPVQTLKDVPEPVSIVFAPGKSTNANHEGLEERRRSRNQIWVFRVLRTRRVLRGSVLSAPRSSARIEARQVEQRTDRSRCVCRRR
jgi:DNA-binding beta-propeller fold protein YncE